MITISICMIVKNEEKVLDRCLNSIKKFADEIIIVDTGSTDRTKEIAKKYTDKIFDFKWIDDFSAARNFSFSKATKDYQMWIDADDIVAKNEVNKIIKLKQSLSPDIDLVMMKYDTHFDEWGNAISTSTRSRILKKEKNYKWIDPIHEYIGVCGNILKSDIRITHKKEVIADSRRNIKIYEILEEKKHNFNPRQLYYFAKELKDHKEYYKAINYFNRFLETNEGWVEDNISTCFNLASCYNAVNETSKILPILMKSFNYDSPRAEICGEIGYYYKYIKDYEKAIKWFLIAYNLEKINTTGFVLNDYWDYIPCIELCFCYYQIGEIEKSKEFNKKAERYKANSAAVLYNNKIFASISSL